MIAHPDYSKVLLAPGLAHLPEVQEFLENPVGDPDRGEAERAGESGRRVVTTHALVPRTGWGVIVEEPVESALAEVQRARWAAGVLLMLALGAASVASYHFSRRITKPIRGLERGADLIARGELGHRLEIRTGDEMESLAEKFNRMAEALKESREGLETKIAERTRELSALYAALAPLKTAAPESELWTDIVERLVEATGADAALIRVRDRKGEAYSYVAQVGFPAAYLESRRSISLGSGLDRVFQSGEPILAADIAREPRLAGKAQLKVGLRSCALVPLRIEGEVRGVLHLASRQHGFFSEAKKEHLMAIARQMAIALENRQLYAAVERRAHEQEALNSLAAALSRSLDVGELLRAAIEKALEITGRERVSIRLKDPRSGEIELVAHRGFAPEEVEELRRRVRHAAAEEVFASGRAVVVNGPEELRDTESPLLPRSRSVAWIPLRSKSGVLGVLGISATRSAPFEAREISFLETIGSMVGVALENARLFTETKKHLERIRALKEIDSAITSTLDLKTVLALLLEKIELVLPYSAAHTVRLFNKATQRLEPVACRNLDEKEWRAGAGSVGRGVPNLVYQSGAPVVIENVQTDPRNTDREFFSRHRLVSYTGLPLIAKGETLGVLGVYTRELHQFSDEELEFLSTLAGQAAVAIHNSQLFREVSLREAEVQERNRMLSALYAVASAASQSLDLDQVLRAVIDRITQVFRFDATRIHVYDRASGEYALRAAFENDPDRFVMRSFQPGQGIVGRAAETGEPMIFEDTLSDPAYRRFSRTALAAQGGYRFYAVFPIRGRNQSVGVLGCVAREARRLTDAERQLLGAMADQIAVAIENGELYRQVREKILELEHKTAELERANRVKDEFLGVMSHELRTPLITILGYTGLMQEKALGEITEAQDKALKTIQKSSDDLLYLIREILEATKIEAGTVSVERERFPLAPFLEELESAHDLPLGKDVRLCWERDPDLPPIVTDRAKLKQILHNLIHNAVKFTEKGSVRVRVRFEPQPRLFRFLIADTGTGIPREQIPLIFEKFRQLDSSDSRLYEGVGLGLFIVKKFTELLGGSVEVESERGKGSIFTVTLPAELPAEAPRAA